MRRRRRTPQGTVNVVVTNPTPERNADKRLHFHVTAGRRNDVLADDFNDGAIDGS